MLNRMFLFTILILLPISLFASTNPPEDLKVPVQKAQEKSDVKVKVEPKVTFVELGSTNCIPCKKMVPVMKAVEEEYGEQVKVEFIDVWTQKGKIGGAKYKIKLIPTQVFLDSLGKEYYRHEGFYPKKEIDKILKQKGVK